MAPESEKPELSADGQRLLASRRAARAPHQASPIQQRFEGPRPDYHLPIFTSTSNLQRATASQVQVLQGFRYCTMLEGSAFDLLAHVRPWNAWAIRHKPEEIVGLLDATAEQAAERLREAKRSAQALPYKEEVWWLLLMLMPQWGKECYAARIGGADP
jgi:hypothetical protein